MKITSDIVLQMEKDLKCPILEMFYTKDDDRWYVCFEEYITIEGKDQIVHLDDVLEEIKKYDNIENIVNECYIDDEKEDTWFEQITFEWWEKNEH